MSGGEAEARRDLVAVDVQPLGGTYSSIPPSSVGHGEAGLGAERRLVLHARRS